MVVAGDLLALAGVDRELAGAVFGRLLRPVTVHPGCDAVGQALAGAQRRRLANCGQIRVALAGSIAEQVSEAALARVDGDVMGLLSEAIAERETMTGRELERAIRTLAGDPQRSVRRRCRASFPWPGAT